MIKVHMNKINDLKGFLKNLNTALDAIYEKVEDIESTTKEAHTYAVIKEIKVLMEERT